MKFCPASAVFSLSDASDVLTRLLRVPVSVRQLRYLGLVPAGRGVGLNGAQLFTAEQVALMAVYVTLTLRFKAWELPAWCARAALRYCEAEILAAFAGARAARLVVDVVRGTARVATEAPHGAEVLALRDVLASTRAALAAHRSTYPEVWTGAAYAPVDEMELVPATA